MLFHLLLPDDGRVGREGMVYARSLIGAGTGLIVGFVGTGSMWVFRYRGDIRGAMVAFGIKGNRDRY